MSTPFHKNKCQNRNCGLYYFITYGLCFISIGLGMAALGPMLPYLAENVGVSIGQISFLFTASSLGYLVSSVVGGRLFDQFKGHWLMFISLGLMVSMYFLIPITQIFYLLLGLMFIFGIGQGALDVGVNVNMVWSFSSRIATFGNALHFFSGLGAFISPIILSGVMRLTEGSIKWPFWSLALLFLPALIGLILLPSPRNPEEPELEKRLLKKDVFIIFLMTLVFLFYVGVQNSFGGWIFTYATVVDIANEASAAYLTSTFWGALTLGRLLSIPLAKKLSASTLLIGNFVLAMIFIGVIIIWPVNLVSVWIGAAGLGLALSSVFPNLLALGKYRINITGGVTGMFFLGISLGGTFMPMVLGQIFDYIGTYEVMLSLFGFTVLGFLVLVSLVKVSYETSN